MTASRVVVKVTWIHDGHAPAWFASAPGVPTASSVLGEGHAVAQVTRALRHAGLVGEDTEIAAELH